MSDTLPLEQLPAAVPRRYLQVAEAILDAVTAERLRPGDRLLSDREMAEKLGVSRPTVREALLALELAGFVQVRAGDGAFLSDPRPYRAYALPSAAQQLLQPQHVIEARIAVEPSIARLCALRIDTEHLTRLRSVIERTEVLAHDPKQLDEFLRIALDFHRELAAASQNQFLADFCGALVDVNQQPLWALVNRQAMLSPDARLGQVQEHRAIVAAISSGDADAAAKAAQDHLEKLKTAVFGGTAED
jgi:GntR family uxuAB operon transcriptional repressor